MGERDRPSSPPTHGHMHAHAHTRTHTRAHICAHTHAHTHTHTCAHTRVGARARTQRSLHAELEFLSQSKDTEGLPRWLCGEDFNCQCRRRGRHRFRPWVRKIPWRRKWQPTLQYSCLGNPLDRGAWWATVHEVVNSGP